MTKERMWVGETTGSQWKLIQFHGETPQIQVSLLNYEINMALLMDEINRISHNTRSTTTRFARAFKENGDEILRLFTSQWFSGDHDA